MTGSPTEDHGQDRGRDEDLRRAFELLTADPPATSIDPEAALAQAARRRVSRHQSARVVGVAAAIVVVAVTASVLSVRLVATDRSTATHEPAVVTTGSPEPTLRDTTSPLASAASVTCSPEGITVEPGRIQTTPAGVVLEVRNTGLPRGTYLAYESSGAGGVAGGDPLPGGPDGQTGARRWVRSLAPGTITVTCDPSGRAGQSFQTTLQVSDPGGYWRGDANLAALGCTLGGLPDWAISAGTGPTAEAAATATAQAFQSMAPNASDRYTVEPAYTGYVGAKAQVWLLRRNEQPYATLQVAKTPRFLNRARGGYDAGPDWLCK